MHLWVVNRHGDLEEVNVDGLGHGEGLMGEIESRVHVTPNLDVLFPSAMRSSLATYAYPSFSVLSRTITSVSIFPSAASRHCPHTKNTRVLFRSPDGIPTLQVSPHPAHLRNTTHLDPGAPLPASPFPPGRHAPTTPQTPTPTARRHPAILPTLHIDSQHNAVILIAPQSQ